MHGWRSGLLFPLALILAACVVSTDGGYAPPGNTEFVAMHRLGELDGVYRGTSDASVGRSGGRIWESLGKIIWPDERTLHSHAARVEIRAQGEGRLLVKAFDYDGVERKRQVFAAGRDFDFTAGRIEFHRRNLLLQDRQDPLLGPDVTKVVMGLDQQRQGKVRLSYAGAGLFMFVPTAIRQTTDLRFRRIGD